MRCLDDCTGLISTKPPKVADQEKVGVKCWKLLATHIRSFFEPDVLHGLWNDCSACPAIVMNVCTVYANFGLQRLTRDGVSFDPAR